MESVGYYGYAVYEDGTIIGKRGKPLNPCDNGRGYLIVGVCDGGRVRTKAVHVIVAECFVENPEDLPEVDHIDGNKLNNHYSNLRWITRGGNIKHAYDLKARNPVGKGNANCKLSEEEVKEICYLLQEGFSQAKIRDFGYPYSTVRAIKQRRQWTHISKHYIWA